MAEIPFPAWDPVFLDLWGPIDLRWYGLMYVVGFVCAQWILSRQSRVGFLPVPADRVGDLLFYLILGVVLGGRLGYTLFYQPAIFSEPLKILRVWEGGMSFHGGFLGVVIAFVLFARKHRLNGWRLADCMALATCPGIFAVRCANFINGELWGRKIAPEDVDSIPWAMRFPTEGVAQRAMGIPANLEQRERELAMLAKIEDGTWARVQQAMDQLGPGKDPNYVYYRHPSQVYEALAEGLLLGLILWAAWRFSGAKKLGAGVFAGIFVGGYGLMRFFIEYYREPDEHLGLQAFDLSRGQQLCAAMIVAGIAMIFMRRNKHIPFEPPAPVTETVADSQEPAS